jgi:hypothetical protein
MWIPLDQKEGTQGADHDWRRAADMMKKGAQNSYPP